MTPRETPIDDPAALAARVAAWPPGAPLALDTEFVRERTYYPRLCLCRWPPADDVALVDVLAIPDGGALARRARRSRAHQADARRAPGHRGAPAADRQPARARSSTRSRRRRCSAFPRRSAMPTWCSSCSASRSPKATRARTGRGGRSRPSSSPTPPTTCATCRRSPRSSSGGSRRPAGATGWPRNRRNSTTLSLYRVEPADAWRRLKGLERLDAPAFRAAQRLAAWRERRAMDRDLPRGWVLPDAAIHELAQRGRRRRDELARIDERAARHGRARGRTTCSRLIDAPADDEGAARAETDPGRPGPAEVRQLKKLAGTSSQAIAARTRHPAGGAGDATRTRGARARRARTAGADRLAPRSDRRDRCSQRWRRSR